MIEDSRIHGSLIQWLTIVNALWNRLDSARWWAAI